MPTDETTEAAKERKPTSATERQAEVADLQRSLQDKNPLNQDKKPNKQQTKNETKELRAALSQEQDRYIRLLAEVDNFKKRMTREKEELTFNVLAHVFEDMLCVLDSFDKGIKVEHSDDTFVRGMKMIEEQFRSVLTSHGLEAMTAVGKTFDPNVHQAIQRIEVDDEENIDRVQVELAKGYTLKGRLLRPAMVGVGVAPPQKEIPPPQR